MTESTPSRILIVEDEYLLADDLRTMLSHHGMIVIGPVATESGALALMEREKVDCAILDINLGGNMVYPLARELEARRVPFLFVSGYDNPAPDAGFHDIELIQKPFAPEAVIAGITGLLARSNEADG